MKRVWFYLFLILLSPKLFADSPVFLPNPLSLRPVDVDFLRALADCRSVTFTEAMTLRIALSDDRLTVDCEEPVVIQGPLDTLGQPALTIVGDRVTRTCGLHWKISQGTIKGLIFEKFVHNALCIEGDGNRIENNIIRESGGMGIHILGSRNRILNNGIYENGSAGVQVQSGRQNEISENRFWDNGGLAIALGASGNSTPSNDNWDLDSGPNDLLNTPELNSVFAEEGQPDLFWLEGAAKPYSRVEVYVADPGSSDPEGEFFLDSINTEAGRGGGLAEFEILIDERDLLGRRVTALVIDSQGNTSPFSQAIYLEELLEEVSEPPPADEVTTPDGDQNLGDEEPEESPVGDETPSEDPPSRTPRRSRSETISPSATSFAYVQGTGGCSLIR